MANSNGGSKKPSDPQRLALGLSRFLEAFADQHRAMTWKQLSIEDPENWRYYVLSALNDPETNVFFNLKDVNVGAGLLRAASGRGGPTDWELLIIQQNPAWWLKIHWLDGELSTTNSYDDEANT